MNTRILNKHIEELDRLGRQETFSPKELEHIDTLLAKIEKMYQNEIQHMEKENQDLAETTSLYAKITDAFSDAIPKLKAYLIQRFTAEARASKTAADTDEIAKIRAGLVG